MQVQGGEELREGPTLEACYPKRSTEDCGQKMLQNLETFGIRPMGCQYLYYWLSIAYWGLKGSKAFFTTRKPLLPISLHRLGKSQVSMPQAIARVGGRLLRRKYGRSCCSSGTCVLPGHTSLPLSMPCSELII